MNPIEITKEEFDILKENMTLVDMTYDLLDILEELDKKLNLLQYYVYLPKEDSEHIVFLLQGKGLDHVKRYYKYSIEYKYPLQVEIDYVQLYRKNHFKVGAVDFSFEQLPKAELFSKPFTILTAWNPNNQLTLSRINVMHNDVLEKELRNCKFSFDEAVGYLDDHMEESYCVYDISFEEAMRLVEKFHQYSIFYNDTKTIGYYEVETSKVIIEKKILGE